MKAIEKLTKKERLALYKRALEVCETEVYPSGLDGGALCLLLPCLYWKLKDYCDKRPDTKKTWSFTDTKIWFPEIAEWVKIYYTMWDNVTEERIKTLERIIAKMEKPAKKSLSTT